ncbi:MAG: nitroreductase family protein [Dehalococcoidia bacterium]|nr:nitroreductase family protein [Dehalococcoidia bacterium]
MEFKQVIGRRRAIRFFLPHRPVERQKIEKMLEAARRASCVGNVNSARGIVIWKDQASAQLIKTITPPLGYQQMQTAPCFILWYHDTSAYEITKWVQDLKNLADTRRIGTDVDETKAEIDRLLKPVFGAAWQQMAVSPLAFMDLGLAVCQAMLIAYDEGLGVCPMSSPRLEQVGKLLKLPDTAVPVCLMAVGYPAESWEAGGQTVKAPFDNLFHEMEYGRAFERDPAVEKELVAAGMLQAPAPLPWRDAELKYLENALKLERRIIAFPAPDPAPADGGS